MNTSRLIVWALIFYPVYSFGMSSWLPSWGLPSLTIRFDHGDAGQLGHDIIHGMGEALRDNLAPGGNGNQAGNVHQAARGFINAIAQGINQEMMQNAQGQAGHGQQAIHNFFTTIFQAVDQQFVQNAQGHDGAAQQAVAHVFGAFADQWEDGGEGNRIFQEFTQAIGRQFQEGQSAEQASQDFIEYLNRLIQEGGNVDGLTDNFRAFIEREAREIEAAIAQDSDIDRALGEVAEIGPRAFNRAWDLLVNRNIGKTGAYCAASIAMLVSGYYGTQLAWEMIRQHMLRPQLLIDYDTKGIVSYAKSFVWAEKPIRMIFPHELDQQLTDIVRAARVIRRKIVAGEKNISFRNLLLWGPPGTGKTMFAKRLAQESGLAWAHMSGASFSKFKDGEGIQALDDLMKWANRQHGVLIFIDEAESLISKREHMDPSSKGYQLLNNFLNYTGERSDRFMLVMATNHKDVIDSAMHRRIDDMVHIDLPNQEQRARVLALYRDALIKRCGNTAFAQSVRMALSNRSLMQIAKQTAGLSNGDLASIINMIKTDADITEAGVITKAIIQRVVMRMMDKLHAFNSSQSA